MDRDMLMLISLCAQVPVLMAALITMTPGLRRHRIGITLLICWVTGGLAIYGLRACGDGLSSLLWATWFAPLGGVLSAWAVLDLALYVHRLRGMELKKAEEFGEEPCSWHDTRFRVRQ